MTKEKIKEERKKTLNGGKIKIKNVHCLKEKKKGGAKTNNLRETWSQHRTSEVVTDTSKQQEALHLGKYGPYHTAPCSLLNNHTS